MEDSYFGRYRFIIIFLAIYFISKFAPFFAPSLIDRIPFLSNIADAYLICFVSFLVIRNFEKIKSFLKSKVVGPIMDRDCRYKSDLFRFITMSMITTILADILLTTLSGSSAEIVISEFIPGYNIFKQFYSNYTGSVSLSYNNTGFTKSFPNMEGVSLKGAIDLLPFPPIGALLIFIFRQIRSKAILNNRKHDYPGTTLILLFLFIIPLVILISNIYIHLYGTINPTIKADNRESSIRIYGQEEVSLLLLKYLLNPFAYVIIISIWVFDWVLSSNSQHSTEIDNKSMKG